jgi:hypothetical protein
VACVEPLRVATVQALEAGGQLRDRRFEDEVVVVRHQAEGMEAPVVATDDEAEEPEEEPAVVVVPVDRDPPGAARSHVEEPVLEDVARRSCHRSEDTRRSASSRPPVHKQLHF